MRQVLSDQHVANVLPVDSQKPQAHPKPGGTSNPQSKWMTVPS
jgi:hypothetical protein